MSRRNGLLVGVAMTASLAIGIAVGILFVRNEPGASPGAAAPSPSAAAPIPKAPEQPPPPSPPVHVGPAGVRITHLQETEAHLNRAQQAVVLRYTGGDVRFWIEIESAGAKEIIDPISASIQWRLEEKLLGEIPVESDGIVEGEFLWARAWTDRPAAEQRWTIYQSRDFVAEKRHGSHWAMGRPDVFFWRNKLAAQRHAQVLCLVAPSAFPNLSSALAQIVMLKRIQETFALDCGPAKLIVKQSKEVDLAIPSPLPLDREVCLKEIREELQDGPELHHGVIRVMCQVVAVKDNPPSAAAFYKCGSDQQRSGEYDKAIKKFERTINLDPRHAAACNSLAWLKATCPQPSYRDGQKAVEMAIRACELTAWKEPKYIDTLAAAYAEAGDFAQATKYQRQVLELQPSKGQADKTARERLTLYEQKQAFRADR